MLFDSLVIERHTVTIHGAAGGVDDNGDAIPGSPTDREVTDILFAPEGVTESTDPRSPAVLGSAQLLGDTGPCGAEDTITHPDDCCSGEHFARGTWQVVGGSRGWGGGNFQVPINKAG